MPVEIRELVIRAVASSPDGNITSPCASGGGGQGKSKNKSKGSSSGTECTDDTVTLAVRQVLRILRETRER